MTTVTGSSPASRFRGPSTPAPGPKKSGAHQRKADFGVVVFLRLMFFGKFEPVSRTLVIITARFICFLFISASTTLWAQNKEPQDGQNPVQQADLVHFGDEIDVDVVGGFEFDWRGTITPEGHLDGLQTFDSPVLALCRTESEIAADVARTYSKILRDPKVIVRIIDRSNRAIARVDGAVRTPTRFSIRRKVTLQELLVLSGGIVSGASGEIEIFRPANLSCSRSAKSSWPEDNRSQSINIKISDLLSGKGSSNPIVLSGDIVTVARAFRVYLIGAISSPGPVYLSSKLSLSRAIASAGGVTKDADVKTVKIFRRSSSGTEVKDIDFEKILRGELEDEVLHSFDIIEVPAKGGGKRLFPPTSPPTLTQDTDLAQMPLKIID